VRLATRAGQARRASRWEGPPCSRAGGGRSTSSPWPGPSCAWRRTSSTSCPDVSTWCFRTAVSSRSLPATSSRCLQGTTPGSSEMGPPSRSTGARRLGVGAPKPGVTGNRWKGPDGSRAVEPMRSALCPGQGCSRSAPGCSPNHPTNARPHRPDRGRSGLEHQSNAQPRHIEEGRQNLRDGGRKGGSSRLTSSCAVSCWRFGPKCAGVCRRLLLMGAGRALPHPTPARRSSQRCKSSVTEMAPSHALHR
jgi:hypothetical protein